MATSLAEFQEHVRRLQTNVDVLLQLSEIFRVQSVQFDKPIRIAGRKTLWLMRHATGLEIVSRLYRLVDKETTRGTLSFSELKKRLDDAQLQQELFVGFNYDGRKSRTEFDTKLSEIQQLISAVSGSVEMQRVRIFRHRFAGHMIPQPGDLKRYDASANVEVLQTNELHDLADRLAQILDKVRYVEARSEFRSESIRKMARENAEAYFSNKPRKDWDDKFHEPPLEQPEDESNWLEAMLSDENGPAEAN